MYKSLKERIKETNLSFPEIERQTGVKANRMYKWYQQGTNPKTEDADKLEAWLKTLEKSTNTDKPEEEPLPEYRLSLEKSIENLTENELRTTAIIERMLTLLEHKYGVKYDLNLPIPGQEGTKKMKRKNQQNAG